jgi:monooxygenase
LPQEPRRTVGLGASLSFYVSQGESVPSGATAVICSGSCGKERHQSSRITERGIALKSGRELEADIVVAATGLQLQMLGGIELRIDGKVKHLGERMTYRGVLLQDTPNFTYMIGYTNASWTLKVDMAADYVCRLLDEMDRRGVKAVTPRAPSGELQDEGILDSLRAGYVQRGGPRDVSAVHR